MHHFAPQRLLIARKKAGKSREEVAVDIGRSYQSIAAYEKGHIAPGADVLARLADAVGVLPGDLFECAA